jgi:DNA-binding transcriptional MerR regulator/methylmalonyl-CoA mutase cobalamin-binding subunit
MRMPEPASQGRLPPLDTYSDRPLFNTKAVVTQTSVPAPTLRAWERRYGILTPQRGENDYRLYSERDIATVTWLRERVRSGMTISQAIALLKSLEPARRRGRKGVRAPHPPDAESAPATRLDLREMQRDLLRQLTLLDETGARGTIALALAAHAVEDVCLDLLTPVLYTLGRQWREEGLSCVVEHFATTLIRAQLESLWRGTRDATEGALILVGCAPGELHEIGPLMVALLLRRAGMRVAFLGQSVEEASLVETARALRPAAVVLSVALPGHAATLVSLGERLAALPRPRPLFIFGGQAFADDPDLAARLPGVYLSGDLRDLAASLQARLAR